MCCNRLLPLSYKLQARHGIGACLLYFPLHGRVVAAGRYTVCVIVAQTNQVSMTFHSHSTTATGTGWDDDSSQSQTQTSTEETEAEKTGRGWWWARL